MTKRSNPFFGIPAEALQRWREKLEVERPQRELEGRQLKRLYQMVGLSQCKLAQSAGVSTSTLRKFERGQYIQRRKAIKASLFNAILLRLKTIVMKSAQALNPKAFKVILS